jgi:transcriptional regulator with XRE-family HTH domain
MANNEPITGEEREQILEMLRRGNLTHREISRRMGRAQSSISRLAKSEDIQTVHKRKRTAVAKDVEGTFSRDERVALADKVLGVVSGLIEGGGLNAKDLRETTMALKEALAARRLEDQPEEAGKETDDTVWDASFALPGESKGIGYDPNTAIGREMIKLQRELEGDEDGHDYS